MHWTTKRKEALKRLEAVSKLLHSQGRIKAATQAKALPVANGKVVVGALTPYRDHIYQAAVELGYGIGKFGDLY